MASDETTGNAPTANVHELATWAVQPEQREFRLAAVRNLREALAKYPPQTRLEEREIEFCEGWLYLARAEIGALGDDELDAMLVEKANKHLSPPGVIVMNG